MILESMRGSFEGQKDRYYIDQDIAGCLDKSPCFAALQSLHRVLILFKSD